MTRDRKDSLIYIVLSSLSFKDMDNSFKSPWNLAICLPYGFAQVGWPAILVVIFIDSTLKSLYELRIVRMLGGLCFGFLGYFMKDNNHSSN